MGRNKKVQDGQVVAVRLPREYLNQQPEEYKYTGDWIRDQLLNNHHEIQGITKEQKQALKEIDTFFAILMQKGVITDEILEEFSKLI